MHSIIESIRQELRNNADEEIRKSGERFFKEPVRLYGLRSKPVRELIRKYYKLVKNKSKAEIFAICEEFWKSGYLEETIFACDWSYFLHRQYVPEDFITFERWVSSYINNWASCDTFCNHTVGSFIEKYPDYLGKLKQWAGSPSRWMRRASAVSLIIPAKKGMFLNEIFEIADILLMDKDDMVQKGYGWMLKVASQVYEKDVFDYVIRNKAVMPRTALRYAIEKMPKDMKMKAMEK